MQLHGNSLIAGKVFTNNSGDTFQAFSPAENLPIPQRFFEVTESEIA